MAFYKLVVFTACATVALCEDCVFDFKHEQKDLQFDLTSYKEIQTVNFTKLNDVYSINIKLCKHNEQKYTCGGISTNICLIKNKNHELDIGSKIKDIKLDAKLQLFMSFEGNKICEKNKKYSTEITFVCNKNVTVEKMIYKPSESNCKHILELTSINVCPVEDMDIRKVCDVTIPHSYYKFNLNSLRRSTNNYLVQNQNRRFEVNICGRLINNNKCGGNITTICDITDVTSPKVYAVGSSKNDDLVFDSESRNLILIQHQKATRKKGRRIEFVFKCAENIPPEKTTPEFLYEENYLNKNNPNIAHFEVATSAACIPRMISCEIFTKTGSFNLKSLYKRVGNWIVINEKTGGKFYLNVCGHLNEYEEIPTSCTGTGKTSACYVDNSGEGISIGSTQIGPYYVGNSLLLNYTDGMKCNNNLKWTTVINFTCSNESILMYDSINSVSCTHVFQWKSIKACEILFERKDKCMVTHPLYSKTVYNMSDLKGLNFSVNDDLEDNGFFRFSICSPLHTSCNDNFNSAACWSVNGIEINIGIFTDQVVFDNGKIYMTMEGEKCIKNGPNSSTTIRFVCDHNFEHKYYGDYKIDIHECTFEFFIYTKHACSPPKKINCTVDDSGYIYDLSQLSRTNSNYIININQNQKIILNVCHSIVNNDINGINCQFNSGVCLEDGTNVLNSRFRYKNLGDVNKSPVKVGNKVILEMMNGFYNKHSVSSIIEFVCSSDQDGPKLMSVEDHKYIFQWLTPLVCSHRNIQKREMTIHTMKSTSPIKINGLYYSTYLCPKNDDDIKCNLAKSELSEMPIPGRTIILSVNGQKIKYTLTQYSKFVHLVNKTCEIGNKKRKIIFHFICGFELQKPKIKEKQCITDVINIDPGICDKKLECNVGIYDLTPIKGSVIVKNNTTKFYINMCIPGYEGVGGMMELEGKNYSIGYQEVLPKNDASNIVDVVFTNGDNCYEERIPMKYSTVIRLECDDTVSKGHPVLVKSSDECKLFFLWKTSVVCARKPIEFDIFTCSAIIYKKDSVNSKIILMKHILNTNEFLDIKTNIVYHVNFCNASFCSNNGSKCIGNMNLKYDVYKKELIVNFKSITNDFPNVNIILMCSKLRDDLPKFNFSTTKDGIIIYQMSEIVCCMDLIDHTNEDLCNKYAFTPISTTSYELRNIENESMNLGKSDEPVKYSIKNTHLENNVSEETVLPAREKFETGVTAISYGVNGTVVSSTEKKVSGIFYNDSGKILLVLALMSLAWFYRLILFKKIRKWFNSSTPVRRQRSSI